MVAPQLGQDSGADIGLLTAIPGQTVHEAQHRTGEAADIDRRQTARKVVQVDARNADLIGSLQAISLRDRHVVIPTHAEPRLQNQRRAEGACVIRRRANYVLSAGAAKASAGVRAAIDAVGVGVEDLRALKTEAIRQDILVADVVVDLSVEGLRFLYAHFVENVIGVSKRITGRSGRSSWDVGGLKETQKLFGNRTDPVGTDHIHGAIATELRAPNPF